MRRSTISRYPARLVNAAALLGLVLTATAASAQPRAAMEAKSGGAVVAPAPRFTLSEPPPGPRANQPPPEEKQARPKAKLKPQTKAELEAAAAEANPALAQEKRAAQADAEEAARDSARGRAEIARERAAAQADAAGQSSIKSHAMKAPEPEKSRASIAKTKASTQDAKPIADETATAIEPEVFVPVESPAAAAETAPGKSRTKITKLKVTAAKAKPVGRQPTPAYRKLRDSWHAPVDAVPTIDTPGRIPLVLSAVNLGVTVSLTPQREDGGFDSADLQRAASAFAPRDMKGVHPVAPRLLDLVYRAMRHFEAPLVHIISGYRKDRAGSRHTQGRAIDMALPGVTNEQLAEYVRSYGFCGVGIYPKSGFVHLDVRDRSYFWLDNSMPGERSRSNPILPDEASDADREASARGVVPDTFVPNNDAEDRAAARSYARRAKARRDRALRDAARAEAQAQKPATATAKPAAAPTVDAANSSKKPAAFQRAGML